MVLPVTDELSLTILSRRAEYNLVSKLATFLARHVFIVHQERCILDLMLPVQRNFTEAGLRIEEAKVPFGGNRNSHVFGLDIQGDRFRMWLPEHVMVQVQAKDTKMRQVVLTVKEPETTFVTEITKGALQPKDRILREVGKHWVEVERKTVPETRHFLCGVDERDHPFIARLPGAATNIKVAHELLKPAELQGSKVKGFGKNYKVKGRKKNAVKRQGEWFLIPATDTEIAFIESYAKKHGVLKNVALGGRARTGKPHTADEVITLPPSSPTRPGQTYMRGKLRHVEHATLEFPSWVKVLRNMENGGATQGATWVD